MEWFLPLAAALGVAWVFSTTPAGKRWMDRLGIGGAKRGAGAPSEDHEFLLRACDGDYEEVQRRLSDELRRAPHLSEAEAYRKAIRRVFNERERS